MRRVCAGGGIVAARDADYAAMTWYPESPALTRWLDLYRHLARSNLGEPDAGRRLLTWAGAAGFDSVTSTASAWCFSDAERSDLVVRDLGRTAGRVEYRPSRRSTAVCPTELS